jgi:hypothetical protein
VECVSELDDGDLQHIIEALKLSPTTCIRMPTYSSITDPELTLSQVASYQRVVQLLGSLSTLEHIELHCSPSWYWKICGAAALMGLQQLKSLNVSGFDEDHEYVSEFAAALHRHVPLRSIKLDVSPSLNGQLLPSHFAIQTLVAIPDHCSG